MSDRSYAGSVYWPRRSATRVYVAVDDLTGPIVGFYALSATSIAWLDIPEYLARKLPRYPIPAALIGRLAVDRRFHQRNFGKYLLGTSNNCRSWESRRSLG